MANKGIVLTPGGVGHTFIGSATIARVYWAEAPANGGTATVKDATGAVLVQLVYAGRGKGPEPVVQNFNPPLVANGGVFGSVNGGHLQIHLTGPSSSGG
jgi:hypothetical protein